MKNEHFISDGPLSRGVVIHIGAGLCEELSSYLEAGFEAIYLVEPNADSLAQLQPRLAGYGHIHVFPLAVSTETGRAALHVLNFADLSSLRQPTALKQILPGAHIIEDRQVDTDTLESVLELVPGLSAQKHNMLVLEAPGEETAILEALAQSGLRDCFQSLVVRCSLEPYFEGESSIKTVLPALEAIGYSLESRDYDSDPDWPLYIFRLDAVRLETEKLNAEIVTLKAQTGNLNEQLASARAQLARMQHEASETRKGLEEQLAARAAELETRAETVETLKAQLARMQHEASARDAELVVYREKENSLQAQLREAQSKADEVSKEHADELQKLEQTLQRDLAVALRLQALARSDQQDLQQRFAALQAEKDQQEALLVKVTQKLGSAAKHLHQLAQQENILAPTPPVSLDQTQPAKSAKKKKAKTRKKGKKKSASK